MSDQVSWVIKLPSVKLSKLLGWLSGWAIECWVVWEAELAERSNCRAPSYLNDRVGRMVEYLSWLSCLVAEWLEWLSHPSGRVAWETELSSDRVAELLEWSSRRVTRVVESPSGKKWWGYVWYNFFKIDLSYLAVLRLRRTSVPMIQQPHTQLSTGCSWQTKHISEHYHGRAIERVAQQEGRECRGAKLDIELICIVSSIWGCSLRSLGS